MPALLLAGLGILPGCRFPESCLEYSPAKKPLSFAAATVERQPTALWQDRLRAALREELRLGEAAPGRRLAFRVGPTHPFGGTESSGVTRTEIEIDSLCDGKTVPAYLLRPVEADGRAPVIVLLHGHLRLWDAAVGSDSALRETAVKLARSGFSVLVPEIRSFGAFRPGGRGHKSYAMTKSDGEFMREAILDAASAVRFANQYLPDRRSLALVGHSLGGHIALHTAALFPGVDKTVVSGIFLPYACLNSDSHHGCQHLRGIAERVEISDVAGLIAPRPLLIHFGERDRSYGPAVRSLYEETRLIFAAAGGADSVEFLLSKGLGHVLDEKAISDFIHRASSVKEPNLPLR